MKHSSQNLGGFVCFVEVAKARRVATRMLLLSLAENWYLTKSSGFFPNVYCGLLLKMILVLVTVFVRNCFF